ncbi:type II toxin-antitoxin system VapC family toxin [Algoriphagus aquimarinus]|uniref:Type II toxin-antitoxin system VapC family toxin n=1 Tax=Algoriphagus aquimarinus TaxID=237018 RepID=A0A5C7ADC9_9BACT|nr:type II toxin-antitoxin system VapC family toxin [Algoriphagus aquimarinus]TXE06686.1 type II toxin-antitoxin system VapC family toxin [Algoriphagus aquimarinus]
MSGNKLLVDTNILIYFLKGESTVVEFLKDKEIFISFITELELLVFPTNNISEETLIKSLIANCRIIQYNEEIKKLTIEIRRNTKVKLPDSIVAATSIFLSIPLVSADKGFSRLKLGNTLIMDLG